MLTNEQHARLVELIDAKPASNAEAELIADEMRNIIMAGKRQEMQKVSPPHASVMDLDHYSTRVVRAERRGLPGLGVALIDTDTQQRSNK